MKCIKTFELIGLRLSKIKLLSLYLCIFWLETRSEASNVDIYELKYFD